MAVDRFRRGSRFRRGRGRGVPEMFCTEEHGRVPP